MQAGPSSTAAAAAAAAAATTTPQPPPIRRHPVVPYIYTPSPSHWAALSSDAPSNHNRSSPLPRGSLIRLASWNIDFRLPKHGERTTAALDYLSGLLGTAPPPPLVLMLQEMSAESLVAVLAHPWVRATFAVSDTVPPPAPLLGRAASYFTLLLVDARLATADWFRVAHAGSLYGRDVLGVDVLLAGAGAGDGDGGNEGGYDNRIAAADTADDKQRPAHRVRFCTTHLESLGEEPGFELRPVQLRLISQLLKEVPSGRGGSGGGGYELVGGAVGGDMNAISPLDDEIHRRPDVGLRDVWKEGTAGAGTETGSVGDDDDACGRAEGHTWGYQNRSRWPPRRFDKFFYTGALQPVGLGEIEDSSGMIGRLGVGLRTEKGMWVSDHFGIAVAVKVL